VLPHEAALPGAVGTAWGGAQAHIRRLGGVLRIGPRRLLGLLTDRWRRSLQLRVVTATLVLSAVAMSLLGYFLLQRFVADLYTNKEKSAANVVQAGLSVADQTPAFQAAPGSSTEPAMYELAARLDPQGSSAALGANAISTYDVGGDPFALVVTLPGWEQGLGVFSGGVEVGFDGHPRLPPNLVDDVITEKRQLSVWASMAVQPVSTPVPGLLIGAPFGVGDGYQLYYFFPVSAEQASIAGIQRTMVGVGIAAVFLLAAVAWLVTKWVVTPVRLAARGARVLSAGNLDERMEVRGSDELAALATSFNEMAAGLQEKLQELQDLSQVQRQFVSDVSHELRTPLTTIRIAADVLFAAKEEMGQAASRSAELLQSQLERFETLLTDLLEISRYDANAATLDAEPVDVCAIVRQSADVAQQLAERRGVRIEFRLPAETCIAEVDRRRVERILRNLLQNAVEHGENRDIVVTVAADSAAVAVSVRDYGVGLGPGEEHLVFDRFWRADPARARTSGGTGLGLAIALEDARLHRGWLEAWGERGLGSVFRLTLPRAVGGELHGSPLPLRPDREAVDSELAELPDVTGFADLPANGSVAGDDRLHESGDARPVDRRHRTPPPGKAAETGLSAHG
jgi:two-component system, OmpR family, sensor histidine kinase MtrB